MRVAELDGRVQSAQEVAVGPGHFRPAERVEDRLVVLVDQNRHSLPGALAQRGDQVAKAGRRSGGAGTNAGIFLHEIELRRHVLAQPVRIVEVADAEVEPDDRMAGRPVPMPVHLQPPEQRLGALEQLLQRVHEQTLAEPPRTRQEIVLPSLRQTPGVHRLVDVIMAVLADLAEGLDADGQLPFHAVIMAQAEWPEDVFSHGAWTPDEENGGSGGAPRIP